MSEETSTHQVCKNCQTELHISRFSRSSTHKLGRVKTCKSCQNTLSRAARYGLTLDQMEKMLNDSGGKCEICGCSAQRLNIDHCHNTNKVRGVLCTGCNVRMGQFDDLNWMEKAKQYLGINITYIKESDQ